MDTSVSIEVVPGADLAPCKRLRTLELEFMELTRCPQYVAQIFTSLESNPNLEAIDLIFCSSGRSLIDGLRNHGNRWGAIDAGLCRLAELRDGRLGVYVKFNGFKTGRGMPQSIDFGAFMKNFRRSQYPLTVVYESEVVIHRDTGLQ